MSDPVSLRRVSEDDLEVFYAQQLDQDATRMAAFPSRDHDAFMAHWKKILANETGLIRTVVSGDHVAGNIVSWIQEDHREIGYWIGKQYWGKGIATAALGLFLHELSERPLYAHVAEHNTGSIRVLEKCGFAPFGHDSVATEDGDVKELIMILETTGTR